ncbi:MAG: TOBE domain-containing protein [Candidatus Omnitrophica bacterium]|nr:TOBE domain-containing protein [Candidatus Omnitrophota bacterium]
MVKHILQYVGKETVFGIRPEDIYDKLFVTDAPTENTIKATCEVIEPMGSEAYLYLNTGKSSLVAKVGGHNKPAINQDIDLVFDMSKIHFFDKDTDKTII